MVFTVMANGGGEGHLGAGVGGGGLPPDLYRLKARVKDRFRGVRL